MTLSECKKLLDGVLDWAHAEFERLNSQNKKTEASFRRVVRGMRKRIDETLPAEWAQRVCLVTDHEDGYSTRTVEIEINMPKKTSGQMKLTKLTMPSQGDTKTARQEVVAIAPYQKITIREDEKGRLRIEILANGGYTNRQRRLMNQIAKCFPKSAIVVPMAIGCTK